MTTRVLLVLTLLGAGCESSPAGGGVLGGDMSAFVDAQSGAVDLRNASGADFASSNARDLTTASAPDLTPAASADLGAAAPDLSQALADLSAAGDAWAMPDLAAPWVSATCADWEIMPGTLDFGQNLTRLPLSIRKITPQDGEITDVILFNQAPGFFVLDKGNLTFPLTVAQGAATTVYIDFQGLGPGRRMAGARFTLKPQCTLDVTLLGG